MNAPRLSSNALAVVPVWSLGSAWLHMQALAWAVHPASSAAAPPSLLGSTEARCRLSALLLLSAVLGFPARVRGTVGSVFAERIEFLAAWVGVFASAASVSAVVHQKVFLSRQGREVLPGCSATRRLSTAPAPMPASSAFLVSAAALRGCQPNSAVERTNNGGSHFSACLRTAAVVCLSPLR